MGLDTILLSKCFWFGRIWPGKCQSDSPKHQQLVGDPSPTKSFGDMLAQSVWFFNTLTAREPLPTKKLLLICSRSDCWGWTGARDATRPMAGFAPSHLTLLNKWRIFQTQIGWGGVFQKEIWEWKHRIPIFDISRSSLSQAFHQVLPGKKQHH